MPRKKANQQVPSKVENLTPTKILSLLAPAGATREKVCQVLADALLCTTPIVADGEIIEYIPDTKNRLKAVELILDVLGEKKMIVPDGELHIHFTNILQQIRAYDRNDTKAIIDAGRILETNPSAAEQVAGIA